MTATKRLGCIILITVGALTYVGRSHLTALLQGVPLNKSWMLNDQTTTISQVTTVQSSNVLQESHLTALLQGIPLNKSWMLNNQTTSQVTPVQLSNVLQEFQNTIHNAERALVKSVSTIKLNRIDVQKLIILDASSENYFGKLMHINSVRTAILAVERSIFARMISPRLYDIHSYTCDRLKTESNQTHFYQDIGGLKCTAASTYGYVDTRSDMGSNMISNHYYWSKALWGLHDETHNSAMIQLGYVHIVHDAYITDSGDFITGNKHILLVRCGRTHPGRVKNPEATIIYDKIFSISQYWGGGYFHFLIEDLPRLVLALPFLQTNKDVKVHVYTRNSFIKAFMKDLGITEDRLVSGTVHSKVAYIPGGTPCGSAAISTINALSIILRAKVEKRIHRDTIILIKRTAKRRFIHHDAILKMLKSAGKTYNLRVAVFGDKPPPSLDATRRLFSRAVLVVAPHGAGLSNLVFSLPGVCVVEGLCYQLGKVNLCYKRLTQVLGHIYHGVMPRLQCMQIEAAELQPHVHQCLKYVTQ